MFDYLDDTVNIDEKGSEGSCDSDRWYYMQGRTGYPQEPPQHLSKRLRECYMMGYNMSELESIVDEAIEAVDNYA